eukprot:jgi/Botrbrau1/5222/Bobra.0172s0086.1
MHNPTGCCPLPVPVCCSWRRSLHNSTGCRPRPIPVSCSWRRLLHNPMGCCPLPVPGPEAGPGHCTTLSVVVHFQCSCRWLRSMHNPIGACPFHSLFLQLAQIIVKF